MGDILMVEINMKDLPQVKSLLGYITDPVAKKLLVQIEIAEKVKDLDSWMSGEQYRLGEEHSQKLRQIEKECRDKKR